MIPINKGAAPGVLLDKGAKFQQEAIACWTNPTLYPKPVPATKTKGRKKKDEQTDPLKDALGRTAKRDATGNVCLGFESKLFSEYSYYSDPTVKRQLIATHHGKCAFCESFIMSTDYGDVEHYRPKAEVTQGNPQNLLIEQTVDDHPGYFWLSQTWENLFLSCKSCNQMFKGNLFDVAPLPGGFNVFVLRRLLPSQQHQVEVPMLLYPSIDNGLSPRHCLQFNAATGEAVAVEGGPGNTANNMARARRTIAIVGLNRRRLLQARAAHLVKLRALFALASAGGGWQTSPAPVDITTFVYKAPGPWVDAQHGLIEALKPYAEFSALSQDALRQWNTELQLNSVTVNVALQQQQQVVYVNRSFAVPVRPMLDLFQRRRLEAEADLEAESSPNTRDLDLLYNDALARYKTAVAGVFKKYKAIEKARLTVKGLSQEITNLEMEKNALLAKTAQKEDPLLLIQEELARLDRDDGDRRNMIALVDAAERYAAAGTDQNAQQGILAPVSPHWHQKIVEFSSNAFTRYAQKRAAEEVLQKNAKQRNELQLERLKLEALIAPHVAEQDKRLKQIEDIEIAFLDAWLQPATELREEMVALAESYRNRGAPKERADRAEQLQAVAGALEDFILGEDPSEDLNKHFGGKGWPASIRVK